MATARKSVASSVLANLTSAVISLVLLVVVARSLTPAEIGAFAVAFAIITLLEPIREFKTTDYVVHAKELSKDVMKGANLVTVLATLAGLAIVLACAAIMAMWGSDAVVTSLLILSGTFVVRGVTQPALALLRRDMRFVSISLIQFVGVVAKTTVTIGFLLMGYGPEALALGVLGEAMCLLYAILLVDRGLALTLPNRNGLASVWTYCWKSSAAAFVNRSGTASLELIVGVFLGLTTAGFFNRANGLITSLRGLIERGIAPVAMASFSEGNRKDPELVGPALMKSISLMSVFTCSIFAVFAVLAEPLVIAAFGERWEPIVPLLQVLALAGLLFAMFTLTQPALAAIGAVDVLLSRAFLIQGPALAMILIAAQIDALAVAWAMVATRSLGLVVNVVTIKRHIGVGYGAMLNAVLPSLAVAGVSAAVAWLAKIAALPLGISMFLQLAVGSIAAGIAWITSVVFMHPVARQEMATILARVQNVVGKGNKERAANRDQGNV